MSQPHFIYWHVFFIIIYLHKNLKKQILLTNNLHISYTQYTQYTQYTHTHTITNIYSNSLFTKFQIEFYIIKTLRFNYQKWKLTEPVACFKKNLSRLQLLKREFTDTFESFWIICFSVSFLSRLQIYTDTRNIT